MLRLEEGTELFSYCISRILAGTMLEILMLNIDLQDGNLDQQVEAAVIENRVEINECLEPFFPDTLPESMRIDTFIGLYSLLIAEKAYVPTLLMEYLMDKVIIYHEEAFGNELERIHEGDTYRYLDFLEQTFPEERKKELFTDPSGPLCGLPEHVRNELQRDFKDIYMVQADDEEEKKYASEMVDKALIAAEYGLNLHEFCFWDYDYELLNHMTPGQIRGSKINEKFGILPEDSSVEQYFVPEHWVSDRGFRYLAGIVDRDCM